MYLKKVLLPYINWKRDEYKLDGTHPAFLIYDMFHGQCTEKILERLKTNNVHVVILLANCTDNPEPLDLFL